uniref:Glycosyltransferase 2-like domain-containing protein n=1 Tax=Guillardia theta TaxID=55529 RepID=A0A7S4L9L5_GUITH
MSARTTLCAFCTLLFVVIHYYPVLCSHEGQEPYVHIIRPQGDICMLEEDGGLLVEIQIFRWYEGRLRVRVNGTSLADMTEGHLHGGDEEGMELRWTMYGLRAPDYYVTSVEFFDLDGQVVAGARRISMVGPFTNPFLDPPEPVIVQPVAQEHADYPTRTSELATVIAETKDLHDVRPGQAFVILMGSGVLGYYGRMKQVSARIHFPPESYRRMCPLLVPQMLMAAVFTEDGTEVIRLSRPTLFWAGNFTEEEKENLASLTPVKDDGSYSVLYEVPTGWTQAARPPPCCLLADGSCGDRDQSMPLMGFMAEEHPEGFAPPDDFEAIGYEPPPPERFDHLWLRAPEGRRVSVVLTSCGRLAGLRRTILSLLRANTYPIDRYILIEDSGDMSMAARVIEEFGDIFDIIVNKKRMGQLYSIDKAYSAVNTEFIFHCEDDWIFNGIPNFISDSISVLLHEPRASTVHISNTSFLYPIDDFEWMTPDGVPYHKILNARPEAKNPERQLRVFFLLLPSRAAQEG